MSFVSDAESARFRALVERLVEEHGSRTAVATRIGLSQSYVAKILRGLGNRVRESTAAEVLERLSLPPEFLRTDTPVDRWRDSVIIKPTEKQRERYREMRGVLVGGEYMLAKLLLDDPTDTNLARLLADIILADTRVRLAKSLVESLEADPEHAIDLAGALALEVLKQFEAAEADAKAASNRKGSREAGSSRR